MFRLAGFLAILIALFWPVDANAQDWDPGASIVEKWTASGHGNASSPAFRHWDGDGAIPTNCAMCHAGAGFREFYGLDGSAPGIIEHPVPVGGVIDCDTCHAEGAGSIGPVTFPSGSTVADTGSSGTCMTCHQGRQSGLSVGRATSGTGDDAVNPELSFINPHYAVAAAMLRGGETGGGYEYPGKTYVGRLAHVPGFAQCTDCHDPHALRVRSETCVDCHQADDLEAIRFSRTDFDGNGDTSEGIADEIEALRARLMETMETYARTVAGTPIVYADTFPYFFIDTDADGVAGEAEAVPANRYVAFTPRLMRAAYNYQFVGKDRGAFAHNPHYALQLLHDSIADLNLALGEPVDALARPGG